jgi:hypothetical protein
MADPIKRLNYFKHQFLKVEDFVDEQKYHMEMRRRHNRYLHTWGVAGDGLKVNAAQGATGVTVSKGMAVDNEGREIILLEDRPLELSGFADGAPAYIVISYTEKMTDKSTETGAEVERRWTEEPNLRPEKVKPATNDGTNILLATVKRSGTTVTSVDETDRHAAGVETGEVTVRKLTLRPAGNIDISTWPRLTCSEANRLSVSVSNSLSKGRLDVHLDDSGDIFFLTGSSTNPTEKLRIAASGNVGIGTASPGAKLEINNGDLLLKGAAEDAGDLIFQNSGGVQKGRIWTPNTPGPGLWLAAGDNIPRLAINAAGNVGIGTTAPNRPLTIQGSAGTYMNVKGNDGGVEVLLGADNAGGVVSTMTNHDLVLRAGGNSTKMIIKADGTVGIGTNDTSAARVVIDGVTSWDNGLLLTGDTSAGVGLSLFNRQGHKISLFSSGSGDSVGTNGFGIYDATLSVYRLSIDANGNVGIGTAQPGARLEINNGDLLLKASGEDPGDIIFQNANGAQKARIFSNTTPGAALFFAVGSNEAKLWINSAGEVTVRNSFYAGNSDIYFTEPNHNHTGIGNAPNCAAIENSVSHGGLMILGRNVFPTANPVRRVVKLWDFLEVNGDLTVNGTLRAPSKQGFIVDDFVNRYGDALEQGDVVCIGDNQSSLFYGLKSNLPVPEVDIAQNAYDTRVCGIVDELLVQIESQPTPDPSATDKDQKKAAKGKAPQKEAEPQVQLAPPQKFTHEELEKLDSTKVGPGQFGSMVTHGAYAFCKVDADIASIEVGDLLTTSPTKGHAQKVLDQSKAIGAVVGKALGSLKKGKGKIPVLVTLQ